MAQKTVAAPGSSARVFNTFTPHNAIQGAGDKARSLADSLGVAMKVAEPLVKKYNEGEVKAGLAAQTTGILSDGTKIRAGDMHKDQSSHWMKGYKIGSGRKIANDAQMKLMTAYQDDPIKNSLDPAAYQKWMTESLQEILSENGQVTDPFVRQGLMESMPQLQSNMNSMQTKNMRVKLEADTIDQLSSDMRSIFTNFDLGTGEFNGVAEGDMVTKMHETIKNLSDVNFNTKGITGDQIKTTVFDAYFNEGLRRATNISKDTDAFSAGEFLKAFPKSMRNAEINKNFAAKVKDLETASFSRLNDMETTRKRTVQKAANQFVSMSLEERESVEGKALLVRIGNQDFSLYQKINSSIEAKATNAIEIDPAIEQRNVEDIKDQIDKAAFGTETNGMEIVKTNFRKAGGFYSLEAFNELSEYVEQGDKTNKWLNHGSIKAAEQELFAEFNLSGTGQDKINRMMVDLSPSLQLQITRSVQRQWKGGYKSVLENLIKDSKPINSSTLREPLQALQDEIALRHHKMVDKNFKDLSQVEDSKKSKSTDPIPVINKPNPTVVNKPNPTVLNSFESVTGP